MDKYFRAREEFEWKRNPQWPGIPADPGTEDKIYMVYAVIEDNPNEIGVLLNVNSTVDWGDGTSSTQSVPTYEPVYHTYNYSAITATTLTLDDGRNYKPVLIDCTVDNSTAYRLFYIYWNNTQAYQSSSNVLEFISYLGDGVTTTGANQTRVLIGPYSHPNICEHVYLKTPNNDSINDFIQWSKNMKKLELPTGFFHSGLTVTATSFWNCSLYGHYFGDITLTGNGAGTIFRYSDSFKVGNITFDAAETNINSMCIHANNYSFGDVTALGATSAVYTFGGTVNNGLNSIGIIDTPALVTADNMFRRSQMPEIVFTDCSNITSTTTMFTDVYSIQKLIMPGLTVGVTVSGNLLTTAAIDAFFTSLGTAAGSQTIDVSDNPGSATCDTSIASNKGFTVIT